MSQTNTDTNPFFPESEDHTTEIDGVEYIIPFAVWKLILDTSKERDYYIMISKGWKDPLKELPIVGRNVVIINNKDEEVVAHISNSNSWYDEKKPIEYFAKFWKEQIIDPPLVEYQGTCQG